MAYIINSQNFDQVTTAMNGHLPFLGWKHTNPWMVTHQKDIHYRLRIGILTLITKLTSVDNCHGGSPTIHRIVNHQPKDGHPPGGGDYRHGFCHLDLTDKTKTRRKLAYMVTYHPYDGQTLSSGWSPTI